MFLGGKLFLDNTIIRVNTKVNKEFISKAGNLKNIIKPGSGLDNIDLEECKKRNINIYNSPGANSKSVADLVLLFMLNHFRNFSSALFSKDSYSFDRYNYVGNNIDGKTIGFLGFGNISKSILLRLKGFDVSFLAYDVVKDANYMNKVSYVDLNTLFLNSDVICVCVPLNENTKNIVNYDLLSKAKPNLLLINVSRGNVININDILKALEENKLKGYCSDVFQKEGELSLSEKKLLKNKNVYFTPHIGSLTEESYESMCVDAVNNFLRKNNYII